MTVLSDRVDALEATNSTLVNILNGLQGTLQDAVDAGQGPQGWSPVLTVQSDGARSVLQVTDWTGGGAGATKPATGDYVGATGLVSTIGDAIDIRGAAGADGTDGDGWTGATYDAGTGVVTFASADGLGFSTGDLRGTDGSTWLTGSGTPASGLGDDGDLYLDTATGDYYTKAAGSWSQTSTLVGPKGDTGDGFTGGSYDAGTGVVTFTSADGLGFATGDLRGADGVDGDGFTGGSYDAVSGTVTFTSGDGLGFSTGDLRGADGADGAEWFSGAGAPSSGLGSNGDFYLDDANGDVYSKSAGSWSVVDNLTGPPGADGAGSGTVTSIDITGGTGIDSSGGPITSSGAITVALDAATIASLDLADSAQQPPSEGAFVDGDKTKLDGIETGADVTDTVNVTAAGALMDSEVTNLADVKAFDPADYVGQTSTTGSAALPVGTTAQRDGAPSTGYLRFNSTDGSFEGYDGTEWGAIGGAGGSSVALDGPVSAYVGQEKAYTITDYSAFATYSVAAASGTATISGDTITYTAPGSDGTDTLTVTRDGVGVAFSITVLPEGVDTPTHVAPSDGATDQGRSVTLQSSAFAWSGLSDTHASSDWQVATDSGFSSIVASATADASNLTSFEVTGLSESQTYYWRVRHTGASNGTSDWSTATTFTTSASFGGLIGVAGAQGFGVGEYPGTLPSGFSNLSGNTDPANANYSNYEYSDGSIMAFVPRFYYRIGSASSPHYGTYGANAIDIAGVDTYADEAAANAAGFAMHRAFIDGGAVKDGFFIDKYLCSQNAGNDAGKSVQNGVPISLTGNTSYTRSDGMTGCSGILADAVVLSRARGAGFNAASCFMYSALWLLSLAHGQAATSATNCAWYDSGGTTNYPKGCNDNALGDTDDGTLSFTTAGDSGNSGKPLTGSASDVAKTAHNGQDCGVVDINGALFEVQLGITAPGSSATDSTQISSGDVYVLKEAQALGDLTGGYGGATDAWGDATHLGTLYDAETGLMVWGSSTYDVYLGSGTNQVLDGATSGQGYQRTAVGLPMANTSYDATGTNLFGLDRQYTYNRANLCPIAGGYWTGASDAGLGARRWYYHRSYDFTGAGFRAAAYGS